MNGDLEVECQRTVDKKEITGDYRDYWVLDIQLGGLLKTFGDKGDYKRIQKELGT